LDTAVDLQIKLLKLLVFSIDQSALCERRGVFTTAHSAACPQFEDDGS
jgi:hypothetical protein